MKLRIKRINEETRTVSGFTEFTHNGKDSLMETDENNDVTKSFFKGKYSIEFFTYSKTINDLYNFTKNTNSTIYKSLSNFYKEHSKLLLSDKAKSLKPIFITKTNKDDKKELLSVAAYSISKSNSSIAHLLVSDLDYNGQNSKEIYNYIVDTIAEKKLSKIEIIVILGEQELQQKGYYNEYEKLEPDNTNNVLLYYYKNPFYKENNNNNNNNTGFDRGDKVKDREENKDDISKDNSKLIDKKEKNKVKNNDTITNAIVKGYQQGVAGAKNNQNVVKTMYTAYDNQKKQIAKYMY